MANSFPEEVLEHIFSYLSSPSDLNSASVVCKPWYAADRFSRRSAFIGNCYSLSPRTLLSRFPNLRSVEIKGKPHFADFNLVPEGWGAYVHPWIKSMASGYPWLKEIRLKRMVVSDEGLELIGRSFGNFRVLVLAFCEGFSTDGLASIAANCRWVGWWPKTRFLCLYAAFRSKPFGVCAVGSGYYVLVWRI